MKNYDFVAIDFETAQSPSSKEIFICQVGIVAVKDGQIYDTFCSLVQPQGNIYDPFAIGVHHITPEMTYNSPTWPELWPQISHFFNGQKLVAHNASFDERVLMFNLSYYDIFPVNIEQFICTCDAFNRAPLAALCKGFNIEYDAEQHHNALYDAEICSLFYSNYLAGKQPDWNIVEAEKEIGRKKRNKNKIFIGREQLKGDVLQKDLSNADPSNPFYDKKVVVTGIFTQERKELANTLKKMGADIDTSITKRTNYVLIGNTPGPKKLETIEKLIGEGFSIRKIYQENLDDILTGKWDDYKI